MASVYSAIDEKLERRVAVKILHEHLARNDDIRFRFHQEAKSISGIDHPNIIKILDFSGNDSQRLWIVTEIMYGVDLSEYVQRFKGCRLHPIIASLITREICSALEEVHQNGIVHRDIKPENIMVLDSGQIKLMDFGIAKVAASQSATQTGTFMGSPSYMSPEQIKGIKVDVRTDIYSLNVLLYEIITGSLPYVGSNTADVIHKIMTGKYPSPRRIISDLHPLIDHLITKNLESDREKRHNHIVNYSDELNRFLSEFRIVDPSTSLRNFFKDPKTFFKSLVRPNGENIAKTSNASPSHPPKPKDLTKLPTRQQTRTNYQTQNAQVLRESEKTRKPTVASIQRPIMGQEFKLPQSKDINRKKQTVRTTTPPNKTRHPRKELNHNPRKQVKEQAHKPAPKQAKRPPAPAPKQAKRRPAPQPRKRAPEIVNVYEIKQNSNGIWGSLLAMSFIGAIIFGGVILKRKRSQGNSPSRVAELQKNSPTSIAPNKKANEVSKIERIEIASEPQMTMPRSREKSRINSAGRPSRKANNPDASNNKSKSRPSNFKSPARLPDRSRGPVIATRISNPETQRPKTNINQGPGIIHINSQPAAEIYLNNRMYGTSNDPIISKNGLRLESGTYTLTLKRRGYESMTERVQLASGNSLRLNFILQKITDLLELKIQTNRFPTIVSITSSKDSSLNKNINLASSESTFDLPSGQYKITASYKKERIERTIFLNKSNTPITFNARFKK